MPRVTEDNLSLIAQLCRQELHAQHRQPRTWREEKAKETCGYQAIESNAKINISCTHKAPLLPQVISKRMSVISEYFLECFPFFLFGLKQLEILFHYVLKEKQGSSHSLSCTV